MRDCVLRCDNCQVLVKETERGLKALVFKPSRLDYKRNVSETSPLRSNTLVYFSQDPLGLSAVESCGLTTIICL